MNKRTQKVVRRVKRMGKRHLKYLLLKVIVIQKAFIKLKNTPWVKVGYHNGMIGTFTPKKRQTA